MTKAILLLMSLLIIMAGMAFFPGPGAVRTLVEIKFNFPMSHSIPGQTFVPIRVFSSLALAQMQEPALPQPKVAVPDAPEEQKIEAETEEETESAKMKLKKRDRDRVRAEPPTLIRKSREDNKDEQ